MKCATWILIYLLAALLAGCHGWSGSKEGWGNQKSSYRQTRDGYYRVRRGDSLYAIAFNFGLDWRDIASWNHIRSPYTIYPGQELRLNPLHQSASSNSVAGPPPTQPVTKPDPAPAGPAVTRTKPLKTPRATTVAHAGKSAPPQPPTEPVPVPPSEPLRNGDPVQWLWPVEGRIISNFKANDSSRNGVDIGGAEGQPVRASAAGEVVYSGNGLIGYGELVIIKHSDRMLSAYAHNRKRLVSEGHHVAAGARIAEMGRNDRNQAILHFEIRVNGTPKDPLNYLPKR